MAGLLAGLTIMVLFVMHDLLLFGPFATPANLVDRVIPAAENFATASTVVRISLFTVIHLLVFTALGLCAVGLLRWSQVTNTVLLAVLYGVVVCTIVFDVSLGLAGAHVNTEPAWPVVMSANAVAGAVMGLVLRLRMRGSVR